MMVCAFDTAYYGDIMNAQLSECKRSFDEAKIVISNIQKG